MASTGLDIDQEYFCCSICLDLLKDPVSIPCGHSYCMSCINTHWDGEVGKQSYSCPQCRHSFTNRPGLVKNTMLAALMDGLKKSGKKRGAPAAPLSPSAAHGHVFCDLCSGTKVKAEKSCLQCLVSYCKEHLQPHYDVPPLKKHKLVEPTENLQENMCSVHDELMKMFCRTDQQCICYLCSVDKHKGHHTVTVAAERTVKEKKLQTFHQNILQRIEHKEKDMVGLQHHLKNSSRSADAAVEHSEKSLKELRHLLETKMTFVKQQIRSKQEAEEHRVKELQDKVQQQVSELKRKLSELDTLSHTEDHVHFLHKFASLSKVSQTSESVNSSQSPPPFQDMVTAAVAKLSRSLQDTSLLDPPAVSNKPQVNTAKTDVLPAGAQGAAASQQRQKQSQPLQKKVPPPQSSQKKGSTVSLPLKQDVSSPQSSQKKGRTVTLPSQQDVAPPQSPQKKGRTANLPLQEDVAPSQSSTREGCIVKVPLQPQFIQEDVASSQQDSKEWPALTRANVKQKPPTVQTKVMSRSNFRRLTLDKSSMNIFMILPQNNCVKLQEYYHTYQENPYRFAEFFQVLSRESLTGLCTWEVLGNEKIFTVAVAYKDMMRAGPSSEFGKNDKSWALQCNHKNYVFWHNGVSTEIPIPRLCVDSSRVGVYLDHSAGVLSFYKLLGDDEQHHIYTVRTTFTQPLYAGLGLDHAGTSAEFFYYR